MAKYKIPVSYCLGYVTFKRLIENCNENTLNAILTNTLYKSPRTFIDSEFEKQCRFGKDKESAILKFRSVDFDKNVVNRIVINFTEAQNKHIRVIIGHIHLDELISVKTLKESKLKILKRVSSSILDESKYLNNMYFSGYSAVRDKVLFETSNIKTIHAQFDEFVEAVAMLQNLND